MQGIIAMPWKICHWKTPVDQDLVHDWIYPSSLHMSLIPLSQKRSSPNYPHKNNADNSIKIAFTKTPENNLHFIYECPFRKIPWKDGWACGEGVTFDRALENCPHYFGIAFTNSKSGPDAAMYVDNCNIEKVPITLVPFRFYDQIMRILSA